MSFNNNNLYYQYGNTDPLSLPFDQTLGSSATTPAGFPISEGDMCWFDPQDDSVQLSTLGPGCVKAADQFPWTTNLATTQANFAQQFCGISMQRWLAQVALNNVQANYGIKAGLITIARLGVFRFPCAPGSQFAAGDLLAPAQLGSQLNLHSQLMVKTSVLASAIAVCVGSCINASFVLVQLLGKGITGIGSFVQPTTTTSTTTTTTSTTTTSTTTTTASSDMRLKRNIRKVSELFGVGIYSFNFVGSDIRTMGLMAQEVYERYPEAVIIGGDNPLTHPWRINYGQLFRSIGSERAAALFALLSNSAMA
jgi:hypothetical protein